MKAKQILVGKRYLSGILLVVLAVLASACAAPQPEGSAGAATVLVPAATQPAAILPTSTAPAPTATVPTAPQPAAGDLNEAALKNGQYELPDLGVFVLKDGKYENKYGEGATQVNQAGLLMSAFGDLNGDGVADAAVVLWWSGGGSGTFVYLVAMLNQGGVPLQTSVVSLGDRPKINTLGVKDGKIVVDMVTFGANDPQCCPSLQATKQYVLQGSKLVELSAAGETSSLMGVVWFWQGLVMNDDTRQTPDDPAKYTLEFLTDGSLKVRADCNRVAGNYKIEGSKLSILQPLVTTLAACPPGSLYDDYVKKLGEVTSYLIQDGSLVLELPMDSGYLKFAPSKFVGSYKADLPAADAAGREMTLLLNADNSCTLTTTYAGKPGSFVETGNWSESANGSTVTSLFTDSDGKPTKDAITFGVEGDELASIQWDKNLYGSVGLRLKRVAGTGQPLTVGWTNEESLKNSRFELPDIGPFQLQDGKAEQKYGSGATQVNRVGFYTSATGDLNGDGSADAVVSLWANTGGSGTFVYLVALVDRGGAPQQVATDFLGDRVQINNLSIKDGQIAVGVLGFKPSDPQCCPTQRVTRTYRLEGNKLSVVSEQQAVSGASVTGTVTYRERIALDPAASVEVVLQDVSRSGAPAAVLATQIIQPGGKQVPFAFELTYDPAKIDPNGQYTVQARILVAGQVKWTNSTTYYVISRGNGTTVEVVLEQVPPPGPGAVDSALAKVKFDPQTYRCANEPTRILTDQIWQVYAAPTEGKGGDTVKAGQEAVVGLRNKLGDANKQYNLTVTSVGPDGRLAAATAQLKGNDWAQVYYPRDFGSAEPTVPGVYTVVWQTAEGVVTCTGFVVTD